VTGLALFALPVGIIANGFVTGLSRRRFAITWTMLRRQPLFAGFDIDALTEMLETPSAAVIREHAHVTVAGREANEFYLIVSGSARGESGDAEIELGAGDTIGAEALEHSSLYRRTVTAETEMRVIAFPGDELRRLCRKYPVLRERIRSTAMRENMADSDTCIAERIKELEAENARLRTALANLAMAKLG
jgi:voltage-gated potassium channel